MIIYMAFPVSENLNFLKNDKPSVTSYKVWMSPLSIPKFSIK